MLDVGDLNTCTFRLLSGIGPGLKQVNPFFFPASLLLLRLLGVVSLSALSLPLRQVCACVEASSVKAICRISLPDAEPVPEEMAPDALLCMRALLQLLRQDSDVRPCNAPAPWLCTRSSPAGLQIWICLFGPGPNQA